eukprot:CAMPEP_0184966686 /NCGR_PEP_ID=MMETSP1098-20130426/297_1 /TAXON_ID=89044 /ORGANISM="Spumella elongata, Strain CCAP 955/1" /LENGTH=238 /DNA_ID=CAMNT_0027488011 /DNA_START=162 /DNA_END=878 /DNA_ORIENTATION=+
MTQGVVRPGYGRGSKTLGFPTANLPDFDAELREHLVDRGVYYGWASIQGEKGLYPCVSNIGISPTFVGEENSGNIVEAYILERPRGRGDFYGSYIRLALVGYIRPEIKFNNIGELLRRIKEDVSFTKAVCANASSGDSVETSLPASPDMLIEDQAASELATLRKLFTNCVKPFLETSDSAFQSSHPELSLENRVIQAARHQVQAAVSESSATAVMDNNNNQPFQFLCAISVQAILSQA